MTYYAPKAGYLFNPFLKFPRNGPCPCGKLMKFKYCCLDKLSRIVSEEDLRKAVQSRAVKK